MLYMQSKGGCIYMQTNTQVTQTNTKVVFDDIPENWRRFGLLVEQWSRGVTALPKQISDLIGQAEEMGITNFSIPGPQDRNVVFYDHDDLDPTKPLTLCLPTE